MQLCGEYMSIMWSSNAINFARTLERVAHEALLEVVKIAKDNKNLYAELQAKIGSNEVISVLPVDVEANLQRHM